MRCSLLLSFGLLMVLSAGARANVVEDDCLAADPRFSVEACTAALADSSSHSPTEIFRMKAAEGNAYLARGNIDYALVDFSDAMDSLAKNGADPGYNQVADVLALTAIAHLRNSDPESALDALRQAEAKDASNTRLPILKTYAAFAAGNAAGAVTRLTAFIRLYPNDRSAVELKQLFDAWQVDPAAGVAECQKRTGNGECGAKALALFEKDKAAADLISSLLAPLLRGDVSRMSREEAPGTWSDCEAPEPQYAGMACDTILAGEVTPDERYAAETNRILADVHNDDAGLAIDEAEHLLGRVSYGAAKPPENEPSAERARALLIQAHLQRGEIEDAATAADAALAEETESIPYLVLRGLTYLADNQPEDAQAELDLAFDHVQSDDPFGVSVISGVVSAAASSAQEGVASCKAAYPDAPCGSEELASGDEAGALAAIATSINDVYLGSAERPFILVGVDPLP